MKKICIGCVALFVVYAGVYWYVLQQRASSPLLGLAVLRTGALLLLGFGVVATVCAVRAKHRKLDARYETIELPDKMVLKGIEPSRYASVFIPVMCLVSGILLANEKYGGAAVIGGIALAFLYDHWHDKQKRIDLVIEGEQVQVLQGGRSIDCFDVSLIKHCKIIRRRIQRSVCPEAHLTVLGHEDVAFLYDGDDKHMQFITYLKRHWVPVEDDYWLPVE